MFDGFNRDFSEAITAVCLTSILSVAKRAKRGRGAPSILGCYLTGTFCAGTAATTQSCMAPMIRMHQQ